MLYTIVTILLRINEAMTVGIAKIICAASHGSPSFFIVSSESRTGDEESVSTSIYSDGSKTVISIARACVIRMKPTLRFAFTPNPLQ